ncbi:hypothetical protein U3516DRAFT_181766 [Neocallimastix sp. 'constans']
MLKWGKSSISGSIQKHKHSFSTSELEYKFERHKYKKMDNSFDLDSKSYERNNDRIIYNKKFILNNNTQKSNSIKSNSSIKKEKWLSSNIDSKYNNFENIQSNKYNSKNSMAIPQESIKEKDIMEWKNYIKYEMKNIDYINLNINELSKEFINKNIIKNTSNTTEENSSKIKSTNTYRNKAISDNNDENIIFDDFVNSNPNQYSNMMPSYINNLYNNNNYNELKNYNFSNNSNINGIVNDKKYNLTDYDIQAIEYKLKYNSNYEIENIPEEIIMELLNYQLNSKETENNQEPLSLNNTISNSNFSLNPNESINSNSNSKSNSIYISSSPSMIPTTYVTKSSTVKNQNNNNNNNNNSFNESYSTRKEDDSFTSDFTANISQTIYTEKQENNWNSLYVIQELPNLSKFSNYINSDNSDNNNNDNNSSTMENPTSNKINSYDFDYSISSDYHQFYIENRPPHCEKSSKGLKNAIKNSYKQLRKSLKLKSRKSSITTSDTGNTTLYSIEENNKDNIYTDIISFNDALNLPIEKNTK